MKINDYCTFICIICTKINSNAVHIGFTLTLYIWSTRLMTSELIQLGQWTSQKEADTREVNWTVPGHFSSSIGWIWGWLGFLRSVATDTSRSTSTCDKSCLFSGVLSFLLSTTVMGVLSVTSSQKALAWFPDIEHTRRNDISISLLVSKLSRDLGEGGKMPGVVEGFLWGFTVASLAPDETKWNSMMLALLAQNWELFSATVWNQFYFVCTAKNFHF